MKKKTIANLIMAAVILVIVAAGVLGVGHIRGWFDRADAETAVLTDLRGIVNLEREGVIYPAELETALRAGDRAFVVDGFAQNVEHPPKDAFADRHADPAAVGFDGHPAGEQLARRQHNAAHRSVADLLRDFHHAFAVSSVNGQGLTNARRIAAREPNVYNRPGYRNNFSHFHH